MTAPRAESLDVPYSEEAEQAVLSAVFIDNAVLRDVQAVVDDAMFSARNRRIFRAMSSIGELGATIDPITVYEELVRTGEAGAAGGKDYLAWLIDAVPTAASAIHHAKIIRQKAGVRRALQINEQTTRAIAAGVPVHEAMRQQQQALAGAVLVYGDGSSDRVQLLDDDELDTLEFPPDLLPNRIPSQAVGQIFAPTQSFKSFATVGLAFSFATGTPFCGIPVTRVPVVYIVGEGLRGMQKRVAAVKKAAGWSGRAGIKFVPVAIPISRDSALLQAVVVKLDALDRKPGLIIIDTVSRSFPGGSQNDDEAWNRFLGGCSLLVERYGATVLGVHHTGWTELERSKGSSTWPQAIDFEVRCDRDGTRVSLTWTKMKDDELPPPLALEAVSHGSSLVLMPMDQADETLDGNRRVCLLAVHRLDGGCTFSAWRVEAGLEDKKSSFALARSWLVDRGYVKLGKGNKYTITEAGIAALGPSVQRQSIASPSVRSHEKSITQGSIRTPVMDSDSGPDRKRHTLSPQEEADFFATVGSEQPRKAANLRLDQ